MAEIQITEMKRLQRFRAGTCSAASNRESSDASNEFSVASDDFNNASNEFNQMQGPTSPRNRPVHRQVGPGRKEHQVPQLLLGAQDMEHIPLGTVHQQVHKGIAALLIQPYLEGQHYAAVLVGGVGPPGDVQG